MSSVGGRPPQGRCQIEVYSAISQRVTSSKRYVRTEDNKILTLQLLLADARFVADPSFVESGSGNCRQSAMAEAERR